MSSPFITYRDKDENGNLQYYILQRSFPHFIAMLSSVPIAGTWQSALPGYHLWVVFQGCLRGNQVPGYAHISDEIQTVLDNAAAWYACDRIAMDEKRYKKFKVISNVQSASK